MFIIHWRLQETKIFYHEQISHEKSNGEFFPNYGSQKPILSALSSLLTSRRSATLHDIPL